MMHDALHDFSAAMWAELDDRRPFEDDEPPLPEPMTPWWPPEEGEPLPANEGRPDAHA